MKKPAGTTIPFLILFLLFFTKPFVLDPVAASSVFSQEGQQQTQGTPPAELIVFIRDGDIFLYDHLSGQEAQVTEGKNFIDLFPFPDGTRVFVASGSVQDQSQTALTEAFWIIDVQEKSVIPA